MSSNSYNKYGVNINNYSMFFYKSGNSKTNSKMTAIRVFTSNNYFLQFLCKLVGFKLIKLEDNKYKISYQDIDISFSKFSDSLSGGSNIEELENEKRELLNLKKRAGKCHYKSIELINVGDYLVTGYVASSSRNVKIIHTWIETDEDVIDYTANLVMKKEDYYKLNNVEILTVINKDDVINDFDSPFIRTFLSDKIYCLFRDELEREGLIQFGQEQLVKKL